MNEDDDLILTLLQFSFIKSYKVFSEFKNKIDSWYTFDITKLLRDKKVVRFLFKHKTNNEYDDE